MEEMAASWERGRTGCGGAERSCRDDVLWLAHTVPASGHLGRKKTTQQILRADPLYGCGRVLLQLRPATGGVFASGGGGILQDCHGHRGTTPVEPCRELVCLSGVQLCY